MNEGAAAGVAPSFARGALSITALTAVSRVTGFLRVVAVAAAMGTTYLANTYQSANTAPNLIFELLAAGVLTSIFVPTFVSYLVEGDREGGWKAADALSSVAIVALFGIAVLLFFAAPLIIRLLLIGADPSVRADSIRIGTEFLRLFAPQVIFYGVGMIMTGALHAHRRFVIPALAPIFNNVVVIAVYLTYAATRNGRPELSEVSTGHVWLLGLGTTLGVVAMTAVLVPGLRKLGWRFRWNFDTRHPAVRKGARLGIWALGYAGGYQAGLIAVLILANRVEGGVAAYQWAFTFFYLPHALVGVPLFNVLFTAFSEHAARKEVAELGNRMRQGLRMLFFILLPLSAACVVLGPAASRVALEHGAMSRGGSLLVGRTLAMFGLGLPAYSAFLVMTRAFYALGDAKTPALLNGVTILLTIGAGAVGFFAAPDGWEIAGLAAGHSLGFVLGAGLLGRALGGKVGRIFDRPTWKAVGVGSAGTCLAALVMWIPVESIPGDSLGLEVVRLLLGALAGLAAYLFVMRRAGSAEAVRLTSLVKSTLSRSTT